MQIILLNHGKNHSNNSQPFVAYRRIYCHRNVGQWNLFPELSHYICHLSLTTETIPLEQQLTFLANQYIAAYVITE